MAPSRLTTYVCPVQFTIDVVGGKWKPLILWLLRSGGPRRFNDLQKAMPGVTHKVLIQQLRQLERDGLLRRTVSTTPQLEVDYRLTELGATLRPAMNELASWAKRHHRRFGVVLTPTG
jgi:DNA-binding HxlR family transcriptional regulator